MEKDKLDKIRKKKMEKDKLDKIFEMQKQLQDKIIGKDNLFKNQNYINLNILSCFSELNEVMAESEWKNPSKVSYGWKIEQRFELNNYKKEIADLFHFFINLCIAGGITADELFELYSEKNKINHKRKEDKY